MTGSGYSVTVLKDETVIPRYASSAGLLGSVAVMMATGCGTWRMRKRTWSERDGVDEGSSSFEGEDCGVVLFEVAVFVAMGR